VAVLHPDDAVLVLSVVYDGPPEAGKTTSVRALAKSVGREVYTPEEQDGRTVYFDWLEYTGGRFDGAQIRCHIASVPGQKQWIHRRAKLLAGADIVIFVGDTTAKAWPETLELLRDLRQRLDERQGPPVGVVFQANKRDRHDAVALATVRSELAASRIAVVESVASDGTGIRESFVLGIRLALDRVREEQRLGRFATARPEFARGEEILDALRGLETAPDPGAPRPPSSDVPSGVIWPPVDGRVVLHEATAAPLKARATAGGDWACGLGDGWRIHSRRDAVFADLDQARTALIAWARMHALANGMLSRRRCIVLSETGDERWRLWQIVETQPSLRDLFLEGDASPTAAARRLAATSRMLAEAVRWCNLSSLPLPCSLDTIGVGEGERPVFVGLMPAALEGTSAPAPEALARELASLVDDRERVELVGALRGTDFAFAGGSDLSRLLQGMLGA
jgi:signal recognition particle receptor subunit beta